MNKVFSLVKKIPKGKITTYGEIGKALRIHPRVVGRILSQNKDLKNIPCYRVVKSDGSIGGYKLGRKKKIELLKKDGIVFEKKINLKKYLHRFTLL